MIYQTIKGDRSVIDLGGIEYPGLLADIPEPPKRLFVAGDPAVLSLPSLAISGSRRATPYGRNMAARFAKLAAEAGLTIVTGGARGVDSVATKAALDSGAKIAVVLAGGDQQGVSPGEHRAVPIGGGCGRSRRIRSGMGFGSRSVPLPEAEPRHHGPLSRSARRGGRTPLRLLRCSGVRPRGRTARLGYSRCDHLRQRGGSESPDLPRRNAYYRR